VAAGGIKGATVELLREGGRTFAFDKPVEGGVGNLGDECVARLTAG
jgi:hypothetical protein